MRQFVFFAFLLIFSLLRLYPLTSVSLSSPKEVVYRFFILDQPTQVGNKFRYYLGRTTIEWDRYPNLVLGDYVEVVGKHKTFTKLGIVTNSTVLVTATKTLPPRSLNLAERLILSISSLRNLLTSRLAQSLPEPESSLAAGILLGVKRDLSYEFKTSLIKSGTMHTVAASGYNVNIVARYILSLATIIFPRHLALVLAGLGILLFCLLAGGSAAVVRAGIMGALILLANGLGRQKDAKHLLWVTAYLMLLFDPLYLFDVSWQLSVAATFGILYLEPLLSSKLSFPAHFHSLNQFLKEFWWPTIAATITTTPISFFTFGEFSYLGPLTNLFILPVIPLIMLLTTIFLFVTLPLPFFSLFLSPLLYFPLTYFVRVVTFFGNL